MKMLRSFFLVYLILEVLNAKMDSTSYGYLHILPPTACNFQAGYTLCYGYNDVSALHAKGLIIGNGFCRSVTAAIKEGSCQYAEFYTAGNDTMKII